MPHLFTSIIIFIIGLVIGSFSNVCIYRIPRHESVISPGSHCPNCGKPVRPIDNIPVLSYLLLMGKCHYCGKNISLQYPFVELLTGLLYLLIFLTFDLTIDTLAYIMLASVLIIITFIDLKESIIPDILSLPMIGIGFIFSFFLSKITYIDSLLGILTGGGSLLIIAIMGSFLFKKEAMGGGDIKLAAMIGAFLGWKLTLLTLFIGFFAGAIIGTIFMIMKQKKENEAIPFGPFIALGSIIALFWGEMMIEWYLFL